MKTQPLVFVELATMPMHALLGADNISMFVEVDVRACFGSFNLGISRLAVYKARLNTRDCTRRTPNRGADGRRMKAPDNATASGSGTGPRRVLGGGRNAGNGAGQVLPQGASGPAPKRFISRKVIHFFYVGYIYSYSECVSRAKKR